MASYLYPCMNGCGGVQRFMVPHPERVVCPSCEEAIAANAATAATAASDDWVHRGAGYYLNTTTGERRRGRPA